MLEELEISLGQSISGIGGPPKPSGGYRPIDGHPFASQVDDAKITSCLGISRLGGDKKVVSGRDKVNGNANAGILAFGQLEDLGYI